MILVCGGTGRLGREVVALLTGTGVPVRVLTRGRHAAPELPAEVEVVIGDLRQPASLVAACQGVATVVAAAHGFEDGRDGGPRRVDDAGNRHLIDAAGAVGADVVLVSVAAAAPSSPLDLFRAKYAAEGHLRASEVEGTIVRCAAFTETWCAVLRSTRGASGRPVVFGRGTNPVSFVSVLDVGALVARAATDRSLRGRTITIAGPDAVTLDGLAALVQSADGRSEPPRHVPRPALRALAVAARPFAPVLARRARAALVMDTTPQTYDSAALRAELPGLPSTSVAAAVAATTQAPVPETTGGAAPAGAGHPD